MDLPVVLYGCETWSLTLSEARKLTVIENTVLGMICGPKRDEVTREWSLMICTPYQKLFGCSNREE